MGLTLIAGQNYHLRKRLLNGRQIVVGAFGGSLVGLMAGSVGQGLYTVFSLMPSLDFIGKLLGWGLLGGLLGRGMAFYIPNLDKNRSLPGAALGGVLGACCFLVTARLFGEIVGRLAGTMILGGAVGFMIGMVEVAFREAWLTVCYGRGETARVNLGTEPITVGSGADDTIFAPEAPQAAWQFYLCSGRIYCEHGPSGRTEIIRPGNKKIVGKAAIYVCTPQVPGELPVQDPSPEAPVPESRSHRKTTASLNTTAGGPRLRLLLADDRVVDLSAGTVLDAAVLPGMLSAGEDSTLAVVRAHPENAKAVGLVNTSASIWLATSPEGRSLEIPEGATVRLRPGIRIQFGKVWGEVVAVS